MSASPTTATATPRRRQARAEETRRALLDAALNEFAENGFDAASTRTIARAAGSHQPQINYHFDSKEALWHAAVDHLFARLDELLARHTVEPPESATPIDRMALLIRTFVRAIAEIPELNRIMVREAISDSDRLRWIVERHTRPRFAELVAAWRTVRNNSDITPLDESIFYYSFVGATSLAYANAPEARLLGTDPTSEEFITAHADAVVRMFLPGQAKHTL